LHVRSNFVTYQGSANGTDLVPFHNIVRPIADRVAQNLEIIPKKIQRTRILSMGFTISTK